MVRSMSDVTKTSSRQRWTLLLVCAAAFMLLLDITVVGVALPSIQRDLHANLPDLQWVSAAYALVLAVLLLPAATLGDRIGRRRLFLVGLVIFTLGSLACALATTAVQLELFRALQGVGGAVLFATATPLLRAEFSGPALARALGAFGATLGGASAIGPLAGGVLTDTLGWRAIFFVNLPIGVAAFAAGVARLRESRNPAGGRADWVGTGLIIAALTALMFALIRGNGLGWASPAIIALFVAAAIAFTGFVIYELRIAAAPMADLRLFRRRSFAATGFVAFAISATVIGTITYLSLYLQNTLGYSPVQGGLRLLPMFLASFSVALLTGRLIGKVAMRVLLCVAMAAAAVGLASMAHLTATSTWLVLLPGLVLAGIGLGITSTGLASAALSAVEPARAGMAAGLTNTLRQVGTATGVAVFGALYASRVSAATLHDLAGLHAPSGTAHRLAAAVASGAGTRVAATVPPSIHAAVNHAAHAGTASGLNDVLLAAAAFAVVGAIAGLAFGRDPARQSPPVPGPDERPAQAVAAVPHAARPAGSETRPDR
jgi:EmrB/QacA subfamily drug resistance transporter